MRFQERGQTFFVGFVILVDLVDAISRKSPGTSIWVIEVAHKIQCDWGVWGVEREEVRSGVIFS